MFIFLVLLNFFRAFFDAPVLTSICLLDPIIPFFSLCSWTLKPLCFFVTVSDTSFLNNFCCWRPLINLLTAPIAFVIFGQRPFPQTIFNPLEWFCFWLLTRIFSVGSNFLSKLAPLSFIKSLIFLYFNVLRPHILLISIFLCLFGAPPFFLFFFFFFLNFDAPFCLTYILPFLLSHRPSFLYYFAFLFVLCGAPSFTFVAVCLRLYISIFYTLTFYAPIFCSSLFSFVYLAPLLSFCSFFFLFSILTPLFAYLSLYFTILIISPPFRSVLFYFPFCALWRPFLHLCCCLFTPLFFPFLPFWRFWAFSYSFFLLNLFPFVTFFIFLSLSFHFMSPFLFFVSFSFLFSFSFPFPLPFSPFPPFSLSSSFLLPLFDAPFGHFLAPPCGHPGCKRTLCTPQDTPLGGILEN